MKVAITLLLLAVAGSMAIELAHDDITLLDLEPISLGEVMAQVVVSDAPSVRDLAFKLRNNILGHRELTEAAHDHYTKSSCGTPLQRLEEHVARGVERRRNSLRYAAVARRRCYQRNNSARELYPKIQKWKQYRTKAIKNLQRAAKRYFKEDNRLKAQLEELESGLKTVQTLQSTLAIATADSFIQKSEVVSLIEAKMTATDSLSQQVYSTVSAAIKDNAPIDSLARLVYGVSTRIKAHLATVHSQRERARSSWISLKASLQARVDSLNVRISRARARQASIASFSGRNCRLAARAAYKAAKASKALNPARIALENLRMLCTRENAAYNQTMIDTEWELNQLLAVSPRLGVADSQVGDWYASPQWSKCENEIQTRAVTCRNLGGVVVGVSACTTPAPADKRACTAQPSARYRKWLLQHGREFGALAGKSDYRHSGYASDQMQDTSKSVASHYGNTEKEVVSRRDTPVGAETSVSGPTAKRLTQTDEEATISQGSMRELRRRAALRAAKRARARAARAAKRARRNRRRVARRQAERAAKAKKEKASRKKAGAKTSAVKAEAQKAMAAGANTNAPAPVAQAPPATPTTPAADGAAAEESA